MVIDTSALLANALDEPSRQPLLEAMEGVASRILSSVSLLEAGMILRARLGQSAPPLLYRLVEELGVDVVPFEPRAMTSPQLI
jgi:ribonuclease VapC